MSGRNDGGPAFPAAPFEWLPGGYGEPARFVPHDNTSAGMTLRDYFAAKAMQAALSSTEWMVALRDEVMKRGSNTDDASALSEMSYEIADAMIAERAK